MKTIMVITPKYLLVLCLFIVACRTDDGNGSIDENQDPVEENRPPDDFGLITPLDGEADVDLFPMFAWEATENPDGDVVVYDIFLDESTNPQTLVTEDVMQATYQLTNRLTRNKQYFWNVIAKDGNGGTTQSDIFRFTTRDLEIPATALTDQVLFGSRATLTEMVVEFQERLWIIGGANENGNTNIIWVSEDGLDWTPLGNAPFSPRDGYTLTVFEDRLWLIGGKDANGLTSEIWYTSNGTDWDFVVNTVANRFGHSTVVFQNQLWIFGGVAASGAIAEDSNDIFVSANGLNWSLPNASQPFSSRAFHKTLLLNNRLFLIGGYENNTESQRVNDIWSTTDGTIWVKISDLNTLIQERTGYDVVALDDRLWLFGGRELGDVITGQDTVYFNDVWFSDDGNLWTMLSSNGNYSPRAFHDAAVFDGNIFLIGGVEDMDQFSQDVWKFE